MADFDFSCKSHILLEDESGERQPMSEPYFRAECIAAGTWLIRSDGDFSYLLEGDDEALVIDSGYGAGNIRAFAQTLTERPVRRIANTHDHFDHTANNGYFECAYMAVETRPLATRPFPSFSGIAFPRNYPVCIVEDNEMIPLRGRPLRALKVADHAVGSLVFLDERERILFSGDELGMPVKALHGSVARWDRLMKHLLSVRERYDRIFGGVGEVDSCIAEKYLVNTEYILSGHDGEAAHPVPFPNWEKKDEKGRLVWKRFLPHPGDGPKNAPESAEASEFLRCMDYAGCRVQYDVRRVKEV